MININVDMSQIAELMDLGPALTAASKEAANDLAQMIKGKAQELANERLHTTRGMYISGLKIKEEEGVFLVSLDAKVRWIDDGMSAHNMLDNLLSSPKAKRAKDGSKYLVVPFDHSPGQGKGTTSGPEQDIINVLKGEFKRRGIPWGKMETGADGQAKQGKLHSFNIMTTPLNTTGGAEMGKGPIGAVRQGSTGTPFLQNVNVYQSKDAKGKDKKSVMTFRVASSKQVGKNMWDHPGTKATNILEDAATWALDTFENEIAPGLIAKVLSDL